jgi:hypothetical protein
LFTVLIAEPISYKSDIIDFKQILAKMTTSKFKLTNCKKSVFVCVELRSWLKTLKVSWLDS